MRPNAVKRLLKAGQPAVGTWLSLGSITAARFMARAGFAWLTTDIEHSLVDWETATHMFASIADAGCTALARVPLTDVVGKSFSKDGAELLHQPVLLDYFDKRLSAMPAKMKKHPLVNDVQKGLLEIRPLIGIEDGSQISEKSLQEVGAVTGRLIKAINSKGN